MFSLNFGPVVCFGCRFLISTIGAVIVIQFHKFSFVIEFASLSRSCGVDMNGGRQMLEEIRSSNAIGPAFKLGGNIHGPRPLVAVSSPDKLESVACISLHSFPLYLKLEAVVVGRVTEGDVFVPGVWISDRFVSFIVCHTKSHSGGINVSSFVGLFRGFVPVDTVKSIVRVRDICTIGLVSQRRWRSRSSDHGSTRQFLTSVT